MVNKADIVLSPYNFIMDFGVRKSIGLTLKDKIITFDEAHNLDSVAEDVCSIELKINDFLATLKLK